MTSAFISPAICSTAAATRRANRCFSTSCQIRFLHGVRHCSRPLEGPAGPIGPLLASRRIVVNEHVFALN